MKKILSLFLLSSLLLTISGCANSEDNINDKNTNDNSISDKESVNENNTEILNIEISGKEGIVEITDIENKLDQNQVAQIMGSPSEKLKETPIKPLTRFDNMYLTEDEAKEIDFINVGLSEDGLPLYFYTGITGFSYSYNDVDIWPTCSAYRIISDLDKYHFSEYQYSYMTPDFADNFTVLEQEFIDEKMLKITVRNDSWEYGIPMVCLESFIYEDDKLIGYTEKSRYYSIIFIPLGATATIETPVTYYDSVKDTIADKDLSKLTIKTQIGWNAFFQQKYTKKAASVELEGLYRRDIEDNAFEPGYVYFKNTTEEPIVFEKFIYALKTEDDVLLETQYNEDGSIMTQPIRVMPEAGVWLQTNEMRTYFSESIENCKVSVLPQQVAVSETDENKTVSDKYITTIYPVEYNEDGTVTCKYIAGARVERNPYIYFSTNNKTIYDMDMIFQATVCNEETNEETKDIELGKTYYATYTVPEGIEEETLALYLGY